MITPGDTKDQIEHVVLLMLENHSFDQMLGSLTRVHADLDGISPTEPARSNLDADGKPYPQAPTSALQMKLDPDHDNQPVLDQINGGDMGGFVKSFVEAHPESTPQDRQQIMGYYDYGFLPALHALGTNFLVCDRWFASVPGPTWPNRFFALSGTSHGEVKMPEKGDEDVPGFYAQAQATLFDRLNERNKAWKIFFYDVASSWILDHQRRPENLARYRLIDGFFRDAAAGSLPDFTFIEPKYYGWDQNDDHPPHNVMKGEKLIADVYNALRTSPKWDTTLLVVLFDEHGGFYDHVAPPVADPPDEFTEHFTFDRLGVRVPAILISPRLKAGVDHTQFDHTSLLRYLKEKWNLGDLGKRVDSPRTNSIARALEPFWCEPRTDAMPTIRVPYSSLLAQHPEWELFDSNRHHESFEAFGDFLAKAAGGGGQATALPIEGFIASFKRALGEQLVQWGTTLASSKKTTDDETDRIARLVGIDRNTL